MTLVRASPKKRVPLVWEFTEELSGEASPLWRRPSVVEDLGSKASGSRVFGFRVRGLRI